MMDNKYQVFNFTVGVNTVVHVLFRIIVTMC
jgi:hypothetical protein